MSFRLCFYVLWHGHVALFRLEPVPDTNYVLQWFSNIRPVFWSARWRAL